MSNATSPNDLTSDRCRAKLSPVIKELANVYERATVPANFWDVYDREEAALSEKLRRRPLTLMEIESACSTFRTNVIKAMR